MKTKLTELTELDREMLAAMVECGGPFTRHDLADAMARMDPPVWACEGSIREHLAKLKTTGHVRVVGARRCLDVCVLVPQPKRRKKLTWGWRVWMAVKGVVSSDLPWQWTHTKGVGEEDEAIRL
jgi:hypothetical protein